VLFRSEYPMIESRSIAYVRVADRRWDLTMEAGVTVMLPETDAHIALEELFRLQGEQEIFARDISVVDLRLADRLILRLSPESASERREWVKQRLKAAKKKEAKT